MCPKEEKQCVFCNFNSGFIIEETAHSIATYSRDAIKRGHIIVAVKEHVTTFTGLSAEQAGDLFALALRVARRAEGMIGAEKYYVVSIADMVRHYHVHLLPKMKDDPPLGRHIMGDGGWRGETGPAPTDEEIAEFIGAFRRDAMR